MRNILLLTKKFEFKSVEENLKDLEETFRNPNLTLDAIQQISLHQKSKIKDLKARMDQVKENLKMNDFQPKLKLIERTTFGALNLNDQFKSLILDVDQSEELLNLCEFNLNEKWLLLYRGSRDGFGAKEFHSKCDGHENALIIIRPM